MAAPKFEDALARLETIVTELERGELPLDQSLKIFEEGIKLSKTCLKILLPELELVCIGLYNAFSTSGICA